MHLSTVSSIDEKVRLVVEQSGVKLNHCRSTLIDEEKDIHCENLIGVVTIPLGVAGPLRIEGTYKKGESLIPLATTEGALVASVNRGAKAINQEGGAITHIERVGTTRGPLFRVNGLKQGVWFRQWLTEHKDELMQEAAQTSSHLKLIEIHSVMSGKCVYVRFCFDTHDAMGMNMVTIATDVLARYIEKQTSIHCLAIAGNYDIDKKPAWLNSISGRGMSGWAECNISPDTLKTVLKTNAEKIVDVVHYKSWGGSMMSGSLGFNAHFANIAAAFYIATGQDPAHVVEASQGVTSAEVLTDGSLHFSIYMPAIMLGTVGGGTKLKTQTEARSLCNASSSVELAEVFLGAVLAGELSLHAAISAGSLASAHRTLGR